MKIPSQVKLYESPTATHWFDEEGILYSKSKKVIRTLPMYKKAFAFYKELAAIQGKKKLCILADTVNLSKIDKETRDYLSIEIPLCFKAMAVLSDKPLESSLVNAFFKISWQRFPIRLFPSEDEARTWLKEYL